MVAGDATSFIARIPSACRRFRPASSRRDETLCKGLHSCPPGGQGHTRPPRPPPTERSRNRRTGTRRRPGADPDHVISVACNTERVHTVTCHFLRENRL